MEAAERAVAEAEQDVADATVHVTLRALSGVDFRALQDEHRPSDDDVKKGWGWNPETFPPALVERSIVDGAGDFASLWESLTVIEQQTLSATALTLNTTLPDLGFIEPGTG